MSSNIFCFCLFTFGVLFLIWVFDQSNKLVTNHDGKERVIDQPRHVSFNFNATSVSMHFWDK